MLAEKLGQLPLALSLAASYMRACDVSCAQYLQRLSGGTRDSPEATARGVEESFELSLSQVITNYSEY